MKTKLWKYSHDSDLELFINNFKGNIITIIPKIYVKDGDGMRLISALILYTE